MAWPGRSLPGGARRAPDGVAAPAAREHIPASAPGRGPSRRGHRLDGTGAENDACRLEAHLEIHGTRLRAIDFAPESTGRPRSASWLSILAAHPSIEVLDLGGTDTTDADVAAALSACPELVELRLDRTRITVRALGYLLNARSLRRVLLRGCVLPYNKVRELEALRPDLALQHDGQVLP